MWSRKTSRMRRLWHALGCSTARKKNVFLVIGSLEMLFVWSGEEGNFLDWIQRFFVCFGEVVVGTLALFGDRILWGFLCCIQIGRPVNGEYKYFESSYHRVCFRIKYWKRMCSVITAAHPYWHTNMKNVHICLVTRTAVHWLIQVKCAHAIA